MAKVEKKFMEGNEAMTAGAIAAGARFFAGYPISPSSEVAKAAAKELPRHGGIYIQMEDELSSMAALLGASLAGKKTFTATSGPGFSLMQENLGLGVMSELPCVLYNVQRSGPSTGAATKPAQGDLMQARYGTHGDHSIIALSPPPPYRTATTCPSPLSTWLRNTGLQSSSWPMKWWGICGNPDHPRTGTGRNRESEDPGYHGTGQIPSL